MKHNKSPVKNHPINEPKKQPKSEPHTNKSRRR